jgi:sulfur-oxidizing protein SoxY
LHLDEIVATHRSIVSFPPGSAIHLVKERAERPACADHHDEAEETIMKRRYLLKAALSAAPVTAAVTTGLLGPARVLADPLADGFHAASIDEAIRLMTGDAPVSFDGGVEIDAKDIAENGANVPVGVRSLLPGTRTILLFSEKNPNPALAHFTLSPKVEPYLSTRIKMGDTGDVVAVVQAQGGYHAARKRIRVTSGGCG